MDVAYKRVTNPDDANTFTKQPESGTEPIMGRVSNPRLNPVGLFQSPSIFCII